MSTVKEQLANGKLVLGIEFGSTRIKALLIGEDHKVAAEGSYTWENQLKDGIWTYDLEQVWQGLASAYADCAQEARNRYGLYPTSLAAIGISAMMHGYLAFDGEGELLVPFRTWRNVITKDAARELTRLFSYNIPQRWSIAHLYQAVLNGEEHLSEIKKVMTLAAYVHYMLTGENVIGIGDASGMFPIDIETGDYDQKMIDQFEAIEKNAALSLKVRDLFPKVLKAGLPAGSLTPKGALLLDPSGKLKPGIPLCPPEGDAQTGMVATNAVGVRTGNVSAGTSDFAILVLEKNLSRVYPEIDLVTSPTGALAANVHCNNCTSDVNAWAALFSEFAKDMGLNVDTGDLYTYLFRKALQADPVCGGLLSYNYYSGETITGIDDGRPLFIRKPDASFHLSNFMRANIYSALATLKIGMDIITREEGMSFDRIMAHGGLFKTPLVGQKILAAALDTPITVMETAGEGGAWGIALLADYLVHQEGKPLDLWLDEEVFKDSKGSTLSPDAEDTKDFEAFLDEYKKGLPIEKMASELF